MNTKIVVDNVEYELTFRHKRKPKYHICNKLGGVQVTTEWRPVATTCELLVGPVGSRRADKKAVITRTSTCKEAQPIKAVGRAMGAVMVGEAVFWEHDDIPVEVVDLCANILFEVQAYVNAPEWFYKIDIRRGEVN